MTFFSAWFPLLLAAALALYYLLPARCQPYVLLAASLLFYAWGGASVLLFLAFTVLTAYAAGLALGVLAAGKKRGARRAVLAAALALEFGLLLLLRYFPAGAAALRAAGLVLPVGISFYLFQSVGYVIDCYRGKISPERDLPRFALFVSFFPQVVQGPISRYDRLAPQLATARAFSADEMKYGLQRMLWGYLKKLVIADRAAVLADAVFGAHGAYGGAVCAAAALFYCVQLYCDFSGGIDIALGTAQLFGVRLPENFRRPIFAVSLADYWRRWHITLGEWMRDYVFYPLALSRPLGAVSRAVRRRSGARAAKTVSTAAATFAVYLLIGLWHGSGARYLVYGLWNGGILTLSVLLAGVYARTRERLRLRDDGWFRAVRMLRTMAIVFPGRYITRAPTLAAGLAMLGKTLTQPRLGQLGEGVLLTLGLGPGDLAVVAAGTAAVLFVEWRQERGVPIRRSLERRPPLVQWLCLALPLAALLLLGVYGGSAVAPQFIYQQF